MDTGRPERLRVALLLQGELVVLYAARGVDGENQRDIRAVRGCRRGGVQDDQGSQSARGKGGLARPFEAVPFRVPAKGEGTRPLTFPTEAPVYCGRRAAMARRSSRSLDAARWRHRSQVARQHSPDGGVQLGPDHWMRLLVGGFDVPAWAGPAS